MATTRTIEIEILNVFQPFIRKGSATATFTAVIKKLIA
jgi:hypothetical protein